MSQPLRTGKYKIRPFLENSVEVSRRLTWQFTKVSFHFSGTGDHTKSCTRMFLAVMFRKAPKWKQFECLPVGECIVLECSTFIQWNATAMERNELLRYAKTRMSLKNTVLNERSQTTRQQIVWFHLFEIFGKSKTIRDRKTGAGLGQGMDVETDQNGGNRTLGADRIVLMTHTRLYEFTKTHP